MSDYRRWDEIRDKHIAAAGGAEEVAEGAARLVARSRGYRLAEARRRQGMTQAEVAEAMGVSPGRVSQIERGSATDVGTEVLARYVEALGGRLKLVADLGGEWLVVA